jgi:hypothetical protein
MPKGHQRIDSARADRWNAYSGGKNSHVVAQTIST